MTSIDFFFLFQILPSNASKSFSTFCHCFRGNLNLALLPTSDLRLSFVGDDGNTERLFTLRSKAQCPAVAVDEIPADGSGRSFHIKISDGRVFYFWCSEKSKLLGIELLAKVHYSFLKNYYACTYICIIW